MEWFADLWCVNSFPVKLVALVSASAYPFRRRGRACLPKLAGYFLLISIVSFIIWKSVMATATYLAHYATVFALCTVMAYSCFQFSVKEALFCVASCYAIEHISACVSICCQVIAGVYGNRLGPVRQAISDGITLVSIIILYCIFSRRFQAQRAFAPQGKGAEALIVMVLVTALIISLWQFSLGYTLTGDRDWVAFVTALLRMIACILLLIIQSNLLNNTRLQADNAVLQNMLAQEEKRYAASKESAEILNIKYHDMKHILSSLETLAHKNSDINQLTEQVRNSVDNYALVKDTGNAPLNTVLFEKALICRKYGIRLTYMGNGELLSFVSAIDIYALVGNILDNAIDSVKTEKEEEKRYIDLRVVANGLFVKLCCENFCTHPVPMADGVPISTKADPTNHGFGTKSIQYIAQKYGGEVIFEQTDISFKVDIIFYEGRAMLNR